MKRAFLPVLIPALMIACGGGGGGSSAPGFEGGSAAEAPIQPRHAVFTSWANNVVPNLQSSFVQAYVRDLRTGAVECVSLSPTGAAADGHCRDVSISTNGRYVAFASRAANLVPDDTNGVDDVFLRDRQSGATRRISVSASGGQGDKSSFHSRISGDGTVVVFESLATNLVPNDTNGAKDVFAFDLKTETIERVSVSSTGGQSNSLSRAPSVSGDGRFVAFESFASTLVAGDTNGALDVFVRDRVEGTTEIVSLSGSVRGNGDSSEPALSADGRFVAFTSKATNLSAGDTNGVSDVFIRDRWSGVTERCSSFAHGSKQGALSPDGRYVAFVSGSDRLDVFVLDRIQGTTRRLSLGVDGDPNADSRNPTVSPDGTYVAFSSHASNLVNADTNGSPDLFLVPLAGGSTQRISVTAEGGELNGASYEVALSTP